MVPLGLFIFSVSAAATAEENSPKPSWETQARAGILGIPAPRGQITDAQDQPTGFKISLDAYQKTALSRYPDLVKVGSPMNVKYAENYLAMKATDPAFFNQPSWPLILADRTASLFRGGWQVNAKINPLDDSETVVLMLAADNPVEIRPLNKKYRPVIVVQWERNKLSAYINWDVSLGNGKIETETRWDKQRAQAEHWDSSTDEKAMFSPKAISFAQLLATHSRFVVQVQVPNGITNLVNRKDANGILQTLIERDTDPVLAEFTLDGFKQAIAPYSTLKSVVIAETGHGRVIGN